MIRILAPVNAPVCGVFAATLATPDMPFCMVNTMASEEAQRRRWVGRMTPMVLMNLLDRLQVKYRDLGIHGMRMLEAVDMLDADKHYIVHVTGHFFTLHNRIAYDQSYPKGVVAEKFWCAGKTVYGVLEVTKQGALYSEIFPDDED